MLVISAVTGDRGAPFRLETKAEWEFPQGLERPSTSADGVTDR